MRVRLKRDALLEILSESPITQNHWAMKLGLSKGHLSEILNGKHPFLSPRTREKILGGLGLPFEQLFEVEAGDAWTHQSGADFQAAIHDRYVIDRELGQGGMGTVYLARDVKLGRLVAIKVMSPEAVSGIGVKQFLREIRYTTRLEHPNILTLLDADEAAGYPYYVMPYVRGGSLRDRQKHLGLFALDEMLPIARDLAAALRAAHESRVIHCDVKPANILMAEDHVYLADFGISKTLHHESREWGQRSDLDSSAGTPAYVSPEQVAGEELDGAADIYSLGCVLYEMLTGQPPFRGTTTMEIISQRFTTEVPQVRRIAPSIPMDVSRLIERCMSLERRHRPSASAFVAELDRAVRPTPTSVIPLKLARAGTRVVSRRLGQLAGGSTVFAKKGWSAGFMDQMIGDIRYAIRSLRKRPGFSVVAILTLALGVGANTALFSIVNKVFFRRPAVLRSEGLVEITRRGRNNDHSFISRIEFDDMRDNGGDIFAGIAAYKPFTGRVGGDASAAEVIYGELVSGDYFSILGVHALVGRTFAPEEDDTPETHPVAILGYRFWQSHFEGTADIVGTELRLNGRPYTIVGVIGRDFEGKAPGFVPAVWVPMAMENHLNPSSPESNNLGATARLQPGVGVVEARAAMVSLMDRLDAARGLGERFYDLHVSALSDVLLYPGLDGIIQAMTVLLMGLVGMVLVITCANLAGFLLARATDRRKEIALRLALGARRGRVVGQLVTETVLLSLVGGVAGLVAASSGLAVVLDLIPQSALPVEVQVGIDWRVLLFTFGVAGVAGLLLGLVPAMQTSRPDLSRTLRGVDVGDRIRGKRFSLGNILIVTQMAVSLVLLVGAGLFIRSFRRALDADLGFTQEPAGIIQIDARGSGYESEAWPALYDRLYRAIDDLPTVNRLTMTDRLPLDFWNSGMRFTVPGVDLFGGDGFDFVQSALVDANFFDVLGIPIRAGRAFTDADGRESQRIAIVSETAAARWWPGRPAVGQVIRTASAPDNDIRVVGVAGNAKIRSIGEGPRPYVYLPVDQVSSSTMQFVAKGTVSAEELVSSMRRVATGVDANLFIVEARTLDEHVGFILFLPRLAALVFSLFAVLALILASVGLYGVVSFSVARRTREMGIRLALGAEGRQVVGLVVRGGMVLVLVGGIVGLVGAVGAARLFQGFLIDVSSVDPLTLIAIPIVLAVAAFVAAYVPAARASRISPVEALKAA